jgi:hypothetical protein
MAHNCLAYWGNQIAVLNAKLDQGYNSPEGGPGWAARYARQSEYETLVLLKDRLYAARQPQSPPLGTPAEWTGGGIVVNGLLDATTAMMGGLEGDRYSTTIGRHRASAPANWHATGTPDPESPIMLDQLWGRVRNALGC